MLEFKEMRKKAKEYLVSKIDIEPKIGLILGSGLGDYSQQLENKIKIKFDDIPGMAVSTVEGHAGELVFGKKHGKSIMAMNGRVHFYEGYSMKEIAFPVWVMKELGVKKLIITNAAGGLNTTFKPGDLMILTDHLNFMGSNPLVGQNDKEIGPRFPAMTDAHPEEMIKVAERAAQEAEIHIMKGVYLAISGPVYETYAMSKFQRMIGADAVGMSTVPELIAGTHAGMDNLAISCITDVVNIVKEQEEESLTHEEVMKVAQRVKPKFKNLVNNIIKGL
ncbi:MAG: purine-nucleoside phosphorylase [Halanaerobiales bacterium]